MEKKKQIFYNVALCLVVSLFFIINNSSTALATESESIKSDTANTIRMVKTEGTVDVVDSTGKTLAKVDNMRLNSGNVVSTESKSYAYINLDDTKALKMDSLSEAEVRKSGQKFEILLNKGSLFTSVSEKLASTETLNVRTSTMVMGIRGTDVSLEIVNPRTVKVNLFSGAAECMVTNLKTKETKKIILKAGQEGTFSVIDGVEDALGDFKSSLEINVNDINVDSILGFILKAIMESGTAERILQESGLDFTNLTDEFIDLLIARDEANKETKNKKIQDDLNKQNNNVNENDVWDNGGSNVTDQGGQKQPTPPKPVTPVVQANDSEEKQPSTPPAPTPSTPSSSDSDDEQEEGGSNNQNEDQHDETKTYKITVADTNNGKVEVSPEEAAKNDTITIRVYPDDNYQLKELKVINKKTDKEIKTSKESKKKYTFSMPDSNVKVKATFQKIEEEEEQQTEYSINIGSIQNGTLTASPSKSTAGGTITLTATPSDGYELESIQAVKTSDSSAITLTESGTNTRTFKMPEGDVTATATFKAVIVNYNVTIADTSNGSVIASSSSVPANETVTLTVTPDTGYELSQLTVTDASGNAVTTSGGDNTYTFTMPTSDVNVSATFVKTQYAISLTGDYSDKLSTTQTTATYGDTVTVTADYFAVDGRQEQGAVAVDSICFGGLKVSCNGTDQDVTCSLGNDEVMTCTFTMPAGDVTVSGDYRTGYDIGLESKDVVYDATDYEIVGHFKVYLFGQEINNYCTVCSGVPIKIVAEINAADDEQFDPGELKYTMSTDEEVTVTSESNEYNFNMPDADIVGIYIEAINNYN